MYATNPTKALEAHATMNSLMAHEVAPEMPQYDLDGYASIKLVISPETSEQIADLRAQYAKEGRKHNSLAKVVSDAVKLLHTDVFSMRSKPADADEFFYTDPKE